MSLKYNIGVVVNISVKELSAHPIFCLQLCHQLTKFGSVTLYIPQENKGVDIDALACQLGFPVNFGIELVQDRFLGRRSLKFFFYLAVLRLLIHRKTLLWAFEPYSVRLASLFGVTSVIEIHASLPSLQFLAVAKRIQRSSLFRLFVANSNAHCDLLESHGLLPDKLIGAHNAIAPADHLHRAVQDKSNFWLNHKVKESFVITYAGSLYKGRGIEAMIDAAPHLPECSFVILGGPEQQRREFEEMNTSGNVYFFGAIPHIEVFSYLSNSDVLTALYNQDCEDVGGNKTILTASPMKLFEYMASGVPIISSNIGAIPEIIENGREGVLIDPDNLAEFVNAIKKLIEDPKFAYQIKTEALSKVRRYTWPARLNSIFCRLV